MSVVVDEIGNLDKFMNYLSIQYNDGKALNPFWRNTNGKPTANRHVYVLNSGAKIYIVPSSKPSSVVSWQQINLVNFQKLSPNDMIFYVSIQTGNWYGFHAFELEYATTGWGWDASTPITRLLLSLNKEGGFKIRNGYGEHSLEMICKHHVFHKRVFNLSSPVYYCMESPRISQ